MAKSQKQVNYHLEKSLMKKNNRSIHMCLEDLNFIWNVFEVIEFDEMWKQGKSIHYMTEYFERPAEEILLLAMDRAIEGMIEARPGGFLGGIAI